MGSYRWVQVAVLSALMIGVGPLQAATRLPVKPLSRDVAVSNKSVATKGTDTVKFTVHEGEYIPGVNGRKTPVPVSKSLIQSIPRTIEHTRKLVSLPDILLTGTIAGLIAGLDWVMDPETQSIRKEEKQFEQAPLTQYKWSISGNGWGPYEGATADAACKAGSDRPPFTGRQGHASSAWSWLNGTNGLACEYPSPTGGPPQVVAVYQTGSCPIPYAIKDGECMKETGSQKVPLTSADLDRIAPYVNGQTGEWIRDLMRESCAQSPSPGACLESLQEGGPELSGPASVQGPKEVTTGTYTRPDGTTGTTKTETSTTYNIKYGPTYIDITNNKTVTTYKDDQKVGEETSTDGEEVTEEVPQEENEQDYSFQDATFPEVEPFYDQQYPDGLEGVWNARKQDFDNSAFLAFLRSFIPSFSGSCPAWAMSFDLQAMGNFSSHGFNVGCYVFDFIGVVILVTALFTARMVTFGG
ncbi:hypothetical protein ACS8MQ_00905 [Pseudomonas sp. MAHUQ-62]|uniref:hypothetical protein n=1 Tax=Pseudomonas sp. GCM10023245 TaxID=3252652 RepID=UPI00360A7120